MPAVIPANLGPESMPWARDLIARLELLEGDSSRRSQSEINFDQALTSTIATLAEQINTLQQNVADTQTALTNAETALTNAQTALANQVYPGTSSASASGFTLGTGFATIATATLTVPAGYTRALVTASGTATSLSASASSDAVHAYATIAGAGGAESVSYFYGPNSGGSASCFAAQSLTGLSGGQVLTMTTVARLTNGPGVSTLSTGTIMCQAIFLK